MQHLKVQFFRISIGSSECLIIISLVVILFYFIFSSNIIVKMEIDYAKDTATLHLCEFNHSIEAMCDVY